MSEAGLYYIDRQTPAVSRSTLEKSNNMDVMSQQGEAQAVHVCTLGRCLTPPETWTVLL